MGLQEEILSRILSIAFIVAGILIIYWITKRAAIKRAETTNDFYICPKCGSLKVKMVTNLPPAARFIGATGSQNFTCMNCNYEGIAPIVHKEDIEMFRKDLKKK
ncbi:MAG: hypothetical protein ABIB43_00945 [archaeon]